MLIIAHRGNINGPTNEENHPTHLLKAIKNNRIIETDIWYDGKIWSLGHDHPQYDITSNFITQIKPHCYFHAKNLQALEALLNTKNTIVFWHETDDYTITSNGYIWTYPNKPCTSHNIIVCRSHNEIAAAITFKAYGICTDYCHLADSLLSVVDQPQIFAQ